MLHPLIMIWAGLGVNQADAAVHIAISFSGLCLIGRGGGRSTLCTARCSGESGKRGGLAVLLMIVKIAEFQGWLASRRT
jgi:hypothetical protein